MNFWTRKSLVFILLFGWFSAIQAQNQNDEQDAGMWINFSVAPKIIAKKWKTACAFEFRSKENFQKIDLWSGTTHFGYIINKNWYAGAGYEFFLNKNFIDDGYYSEHRYYPELLGSYLFGSFAATFRSRLMNTFTEWNKPNFEHRNRIKINYSIKKLPVKLFASVEPYSKVRKSYYRLNKIRYTAGCSYVFKKQQIDLYYLRENYHQRSFIRHVIAIDYNFNFNK